MGLSVVCLAGCLAGCSRGNSYQKPAVPVRVEALELYKGEHDSLYSGSVEPVTRMDLAFRLGGYVEEILTVRGRLVQEGDTVPEGAILVKLRQSDYVAKVTEAKSQFEQAEAGLEQAEYALKAAQAGRDKAKLDFERATNLFSTQSLTKADFDGAKAQFEAAQATVDSVEAQVAQGKARLEGAHGLLQEAELALRDSALQAPQAAVVIKRLVELGSLVGPGSPGFVLGDLTRVKVVFGAPDGLLPRLRLGMPLNVTAEATGETNYKGVITRIAPAADPRARVFEVEVTMPNPGQRLKAGMIATIHVPEEHPSEKSPVIPFSAVVGSKTNPGGYAVWVVEEEGGRAISRLREVKLGETVGDRIAVRQGLRVGEAVLVTGTGIVEEGQPVQIVP